MVSPNSRRTDEIIKRGEYADAGIPYYWLVDLDEPASLTECHLVPGLGYENGDPRTGVFTAGEPFPIRLDLDALR